MATENEQAMTRLTEQAQAEIARLVARAKRVDEAIADLELGLCAHNEPTVPVHAVDKWIAHVKAALADSAREGDGDG